MRIVNSIYFKMCDNHNRPISPPKRIAYSKQQLRFRRNKRHHQVLTQEPSVKTKSSVAVRICWILVMLVFLSITVYQCVDRVKHYLADPSRVTTYYIKNRSVTFPSLTVCPLKFWNLGLPYYSEALLSDAVDEQGVPPSKAFKKLGLIKFWETAALKFRSITHEIKFVAEGANDTKRNESKREIYYPHTVLGTCITTAEHKVLRMGMQTSFGLELNGQNFGGALYIKVIYHMFEDMELIKFRMYDHGFQFLIDSEWELYLTVSKLIYRNTRRIPCKENAAAHVKCFSECHDNAIYSNVTKPCRLPFMQYVHNISLCSTYISMREMLSGLYRIKKRFNPDDCNCLKKCKETVYNLQFMSNYKGSQRRTETMTGLTLFFPDPRTLVLEEVPAYELTALFCDIGGSVGLFLGVGALQMYELIVATVTALLRKKNVIKQV